MPESRRLFTAVTFGDGTKKALRQAARRLEDTCVRANFVRQDNLHLTLIFLGEQKNEAGARRALDRTEAAPFELLLTGLGTFGKPGGDILWAGVQPCPALTEVYRRLAAALRAEGFALEGRPYRPHVTLARKAHLPEGVPFASLAAYMPELYVRVSGISLMESLREEGQLVYRPVYSKLFGK